MLRRRMIREHGTESARDKIIGLTRLLRSTLFAALALLASIPSLSQSSLPSPDGSRLELGEFCYTITANQDGKDKPVGYTFQSVRRKRVHGADKLAIVVHQHLSNGKFDMRDTFLLRRADLRPIRLDTERDGSPHAHLDYSDSHVAGWRIVEGKKQKIDVPFDGPVWDGNLWGELFAALPLQAGATYQVPTYQYDSGKGFLFVTVADRRKVDTPRGVVDAWALRAGPRRDELVDYLVGNQPRIELGYKAGPNSQHLGGDCVSEVQTSPERTHVAPDAPPSSQGHTSTTPSGPIKKSIDSHSALRVVLVPNCDVESFLSFLRPPYKGQHLEI